MDAGDLATNGATAVGAALASLLASFLQYKSKLEECRKATEKLGERIDEVSARIDELVAGWKRERETQARIEQIREEVRSSRPDPFEDVRRELERLKQEVEKLRDRSGRYVHNEAFSKHVHAQEEQWRELNRIVGRLEATRK